MATSKTKELPAAAGAAPEVIWLHSKDLGETRPFTPEHAANLQQLQAEKGYTHWQPAEAPAPPAGE